MKEQWPKSAWILYLIEIYLYFIHVAVGFCAELSQIFPNAPKPAGISGPPQPDPAKSMEILIYLRNFQGNLWFLGNGKQQKFRVCKWNSCHRIWFLGVVLNVGWGWNISYFMSGFDLFFLNLFLIWFLYSFMFCGNCFVFCSLTSDLAEREDCFPRNVLFLGFS